MKPRLDEIKHRPIIIAEVKTQSPFGFKSTRSFEELLAIAIEVGDIISIHTDPRWGGSFETLQKVAGFVKNKLILAKGIHENDDLIRRALDAGADFALVVGRIPRYMPEKCFIEPRTISELKNLPKGTLAVWNSRVLDFNNFGKDVVKKETFAEARKAWDGFLCQASFIKTVADIDPLADALLVGAHLPEFAESLKI